MLKDTIKKLASEKGLTLRDVADLSGVPYSAIACWNDHVPGALAVWKVSKALDVPVTTLLDEIKDN